jgi:hypothetical protein
MAFWCDACPWFHKTYKYVEFFLTFDNTAGILYVKWSLAKNCPTELFMAASQPPRSHYKLDHQPPTPENYKVWPSV